MSGNTAPVKHPLDDPGVPEVLRGRSSATFLHPTSIPGMPRLGRENILVLHSHRLVTDSTAHQPCKDQVDLVYVASSSHRRCGKGPGILAPYLVAIYLDLNFWKFLDAITCTLTQTMTYSPTLSSSLRTIYAHMPHLLTHVLISVAAGLSLSDLVGHLFISRTRLLCITCVWGLFEALSKSLWSGGLGPA